MKKNAFFVLNRLVISVVFFFSTMIFAQAQTFLGTAGDGLWSNTGNWLDGQKPTDMFPK